MHTSSSCALIAGFILSLVAWASAVQLGDPYHSTSTLGAILHLADGRSGAVAAVGDTFAALLPQPARVVVTSSVALTSNNSSNSSFATAVTFAAELSSPAAVASAVAQAPAIDAALGASVRVVDLAPDRSAREVPGQTFPSATRTSFDADPRRSRVETPTTIGTLTALSVLVLVAFVCTAAVIRNHPGTTRSAEGGSPEPAAAVCQDTDTGYLDADAEDERKRRAVAPAAPVDELPTGLYSLQFEHSGMLLTVDAGTVTQTPADGGRPSAQQQFQLVPQGHGFYSIFVPSSAEVTAAAGGLSVSNTGDVVTSDRPSLWFLAAADDSAPEGPVRAVIVDASSAAALDVTGSSDAAGSVAVAFMVNGSRSQTLLITRMTEQPTQGVTKPDSDGRPSVDTVAVPDGVYRLTLEDGSALAAAKPVFAAPKAPLLRIATPVGAEDELFRFVRVPGSTKVALISAVTGHLFSVAAEGVVAAARPSINPDSSAEDIERAARTWKGALKVVFDGEKSDSTFSLCGLRGVEDRMQSNGPAQKPRRELRKSMKSDSTDPQVTVSVHRVAESAVVTSLIPPTLADAVPMKLNGLVSFRCGGGPFLIHRTRVACATATTKQHEANFLVRSMPDNPYIHAVMLRTNTEMVLSHSTGSGLAFKADEKQPGQRWVLLKRSAHAPCDELIFVPHSERQCMFRALHARDFSAKLGRAAVAPLSAELLPELQPYTANACFHWAVSQPPGDCVPSGSFVFDLGLHRGVELHPGGAVHLAEGDGGAVGGTAVGLVPVLKSSQRSSTTFEIEFVGLFGSGRKRVHRILLPDDHAPRVEWLALTIAHDDTTVFFAPQRQRDPTQFFVFEPSTCTGNDMLSVEPPFSGTGTYTPGSSLRSGREATGYAYVNAFSRGQRAAQHAAQDPDLSLAIPYDGGAEPGLSLRDDIERATSQPLVLTRELKAWQHVPLRLLPTEMKQLQRPSDSLAIVRPVLPSDAHSEERAAEEAALAAAALATQPRHVLQAAGPVALAVLCVVGIAACLGFVFDGAGQSGVPWAVLHEFATPLCNASTLAPLPVVAAGAPADGACHRALAGQAPGPLFIAALCESGSRARVKSGASLAACEAAAFSGQEPGRCEASPSSSARSVAGRQLPALSVVPSASVIVCIVAGDVDAAVLPTVPAHDTILMTPAAENASSAAAAGVQAVLTLDDSATQVLRPAIALLANSSSSPSNNLTSSPSPSPGPLPPASAVRFTPHGDALVDFTATGSQPRGLALPADLNGAVDVGQSTRMTVSVWVQLDATSSGFVIATTHDWTVDAAANSTAGSLSNAVRWPVLEALHSAIAGDAQSGALMPPFETFFALFVDGPTRSVVAAYAAMGALETLRWSGAATATLFDGSPHRLTVQSASRKYSGRFILRTDGAASRVDAGWQQCLSRRSTFLPLTTLGVALRVPSSFAPGSSVSREPVAVVGPRLRGRVGDVTFTDGIVHERTLRAEAHGDPLADVSLPGSFTVGALMAAACLTCVAVMVMQHLGDDAAGSERSMKAGQEATKSAKRVVQQPSRFKGLASGGGQAQGTSSSVAGLAHALFLDALTVTQTLDIYFTGWEWPAVFQIPMEYVIFVPALDLSLDVFSLPPLLTPLLQLLLAIVFVVLGLYVLRVDNQRFLARLPRMAREARESSALPHDVRQIPRPSTALPLDALYDVRATLGGEETEITSVAARVRIAAAVELLLSPDPGVEAFVDKGGVKGLSRHAGGLAIAADERDPLPFTNLRVDMEARRLLVTDAASSAGGELTVAHACVTHCPSHTDARLIAATDEHRKLAAECKLAGRHAPYVCAHEPMPFRRLRDNACDVERGFFVCPECTFTICGQCSAFGPAQTALAWVGAKRYQFRDASLLLGVVIVAIIEAVYVPILKNAVMIIRCHRDYQCVFPGCYDELSAVFIVAVALSCVMLLGVGLIVPAAVLGLLIERKRAIVRTVYGEEAAAAGGAHQVALHRSPDEEWAHVLQYDTSVLKGIYSIFELRYMWMQPAQLLAKLVLVVGVVSSEPESLTQLIVTSVVQAATLAFMLFAQPFIDGQIDHLTKISGLYQVTLLSLMSFYRGTRSLGLGILMLLVSAGYVGFMLFIIVSIVRKLRAARLRARVRLGPFVAVRERDEEVLRIIAEETPQLLVQESEATKLTPLQEAVNLPDAEHAQAMAELILDLLPEDDVADQLEKKPPVARDPLPLPTVAGVAVKRDLAVYKAMLPLVRNVREDGIALQAAYAGNLEALELLRQMEPLLLGWSQLAHAPSEFRPLHLAAAGEQAEVVTWLIEHIDFENPELDFPDEHGRQLYIGGPPRKAKDRYHALLKTQRDNVDAPFFTQAGMSPIEERAFRARAQRIAAQTEVGGSAWHYAARAGSTAVLDALLKALSGWSNQSRLPGQDGGTGMNLPGIASIAAQENRPAVVAWALEHGWTFDMVLADAGCLRHVRQNDATQFLIELMRHMPRGEPHHYDRLLVGLSDDNRETPDDALDDLAASSARALLQHVASADFQRGLSSPLPGFPVTEPLDADAHVATITLSVQRCAQKRVGFVDVPTRVADEVVYVVVRGRWVGQGHVGVAGLAEPAQPVTEAADGGRATTRAYAFAVPPLSTWFARVASRSGKPTFQSLAGQGRCRVLFVAFDGVTDIEWIEMTLVTAPCLAATRGSAAAEASAAPVSLSAWAMEACDAPPNAVHETVRDVYWAPVESFNGAAVAERSVHSTAGGDDGAEAVAPPPQSLPWCRGASPTGNCWTTIATPNVSPIDTAVTGVGGTRRDTWLPMMPAANALRDAITRGGVQEVRRIVAEDPQLIHFRSAPDGRGPAFWACASGDPAMLQLVRYFADSTSMDQRDCHDQRPEAYWPSRAGNTRGAAESARMNIHEGAIHILAGEDEGGEVMRMRAPVAELLDNNDAAKLMHQRMHPAAFGGPLERPLGYTLANWAVPNRALCTIALAFDTVEGVSSQAVVGFAEAALQARWTTGLLAAMPTLGAGVYQGHLLWKVACQTADVTAAQLLVEMGVPLFEREPGTLSALVHIAGNNTLLELLAACGLPVGAADLRDSEGLLPSHHAAKAGRAETLEHFHAAGADLRAAAFDGRGAAHFAAENGRVEVIRLLDRLDVPLDEPIESTMQTPLALASRAEHVAAVNCVAELAPRSLFMRLKSGSLLLHHALDTDVVDKSRKRKPLLRHTMRLVALYEQDPEQHSAFDPTPLLEPNPLCLVLLDDPELFEPLIALVKRLKPVLLDARNDGTVSLRVRTANLLPPLHHAASKRLPLYAAALLAAGADPGLAFTDTTPLMRVQEGPNAIATARVIAEHSSDLGQEVTPKVGSHLHFMAKTGQTPIVELLLGTGRVDPDLTRTEDGKTALMLAIENRRTDTAILLLPRTLDVMRRPSVYIEAAAKSQQTPILYALASALEHDARVAACERAVVDHVRRDPSDPSSVDVVCAILRVLPLTDDTFLGEPIALAVCAGLNSRVMSAREREAHDGVLAALLDRALPACAVCHEGLTLLHLLIERQWWAGAQRLVAALSDDDHGRGDSRSGALRQLIAFEAVDDGTPPAVGAEDGGGLAHGPSSNLATTVLDMVLEVDNTDAADLCRALLEHGARPACALMPTASPPREVTAAVAKTYAVQARRGLSRGEYLAHAAAVLRQQEVDVLAALDALCGSPDADLVVTRAELENVSKVAEERGWATVQERLQRCRLVTDSSTTAPSQQGGDDLVAESTLVGPPRDGMAAVRWCLLDFRCVPEDTAA